MSGQNSVAMSEIRDLAALSLRGLVPMFDANQQLFCHRLLATRNGLVSEGISQRYTIMTLLGLRELESAGVKTPFDIRGIYNTFAADPKWIQGAGDLGLQIWLTAIFDPDNLGSLFQSANCGKALERSADAKQGRTMELAWFLTGLAYAAEANPKLAGDWKDLSAETFHRLSENQGEYGLFGHLSVGKSLSGRLRGRIGSFADQVYPIIALSKFGKVFHVEDALRSALDCARAICNAQGKFGQWWWLYDAKTGRVSSRYPVYSVHQHAMAPMCLFAVEEATGHSFQEYIYRGLRWIYGENELAVDMRDNAQNLIWRCVLPVNRQSRFLEMAKSFLLPRAERNHVGPLEVLYEQRPYEYGWLLYAFAKYVLSTPAAKGIS